MQVRLAACARPLENAVVAGSLYAVSWYPGLVLGDTGQVVGELWELAVPESWRWIDAYEGCGDDDPTPHEFRPVLTQVRAASGPSDAIVYVYQWTPEPSSRVDSGDWLNRGSAPTSAGTSGSRRRPKP